MTSRDQKAVLLRSVFGVEHGPRALQIIEEYCRAELEPFTAASARQTAYNLGRQSVARWLRQELSREIKDNG